MIAINFFGPEYMVHDMYYMHRSIFLFCIFSFMFYIQKFKKEKTHGKRKNEN